MDTRNRPKGELNLTQNSGAQCRDWCAWLWRNDNAISGGKNAYKSQKPMAKSGEQNGLAVKAPTRQILKGHESYTANINLQKFTASLEDAILMSLELKPKCTCSDSKPPNIK